ncbi:hypothetical protein ACFXI0_07870 [Kitasatospora indigofera]|uniref:hypothetical protein n=1 Tax=Kitasatospora indigofera TaxID=67307 RepID=UPI00369B3989
MTRTLRPEKYPLRLKVTGGRVVHMARQSINGRALTACGKNTAHRRNDLQEQGLVTCQACIKQPWAQDQRNTPAPLAEAKTDVTAIRKITIIEAIGLFTTMGLPVHQDGQTAGFHATARGGRSQFVKAAHRIDVHYRFAGGTPLASGDLADDHELREFFERAVERAPRHGFVVAWNGGATMEIIRKLEADPAEGYPAPAEDEFAAHERRLKADFEDARATLNRAQVNFDRIASELRDLRTERHGAGSESDR